MDKNTLRKIMRENREKLNSSAFINKSLKAQQNLISSPIWQKAKIISMFVSLPSEIDTKNLIIHAFKQNKIVLLPKIIDLKSNKMEFFPCLNLNELQPGPMNIPEPREISESHIPDLIITPGLAFDCSGNRLGYGGGFYDNYFIRHQEIAASKIGFCFGFQIISKVPFAKWDIPVQGLCTEDRFLWI